MGIDKERFKAINGFPLSDSVVFTAAVTLEDEILIRHFLEGERLSELEISNVLAIHFKTPENLGKLKKAFDLVKEVKFGGNEVEFQAFTQKHAAIFFDGALDAINLENMRFLVEDLGVDVNQIKSVANDNVLHKVVMKNPALSKPIFELLFSKCTRETKTAPRKDGLTPIHIAIRYEFNYAIKKFESEIGKDKIPAVTIEDSYLPYSDFKERILKDTPEESKARSNNPHGDNALIKSYHAMSMTKPDDPALPSKVEEAITALKIFISETNCLKITNNLYREIDELKAAYETGKEAYRQGLEQLVKNKSPANPTQHSRKGKGKKKNSSQQIKPPKNPKDEIEKKENTIKALSSGNDIERKIVDLLIRFYTVLDDIDFELVEFFEKELTECGMFDSLVFAYHHAFLVLTEKIEILEKSADAEGRAAKIKTAKDKSVELVQKAKEIIETHGDEINTKVMADNIYYLAMIEDDYTSKLELLKKSQELYPGNSNVAATLCRHVMAGEDPKEKEKVQQYLLNCCNDLYNNGRFIPESLIEIINIAERLSAEFSDHVEFTAFYPLASFAQFQIAEKTKSLETSKKIIAFVADRLPAEIEKAEKTNPPEVAALYRFLFETMLNVKICNLVEDKKYEEARKYAEMLEPESEKTKYISLTERLIKDGDKLHSRGAEAASMQEESAAGALPATVDIVPLNPDMHDKANVKNITDIVSKLFKPNNVAEETESEWPHDIDHLTHRIDTGQIKTDALPIELVEVYFKFQQIKNSTLPLDLSKTLRFVWTEYTDTQEIVYEHSRETLIQFPHGHNVYTHFSRANPAATEFLAKQVGKNTTITCYNNYFTLSVEDSDTVVYGDKILVNEFGKLLIFKDICDKKEVSALHEKNIQISTSITGPLPTNQNGQKVFTITANDDQTNIDGCTNSLQLQIYYDNVIAKLAALDAPAGEDAAPASPPHAELAFDDDGGGDSLAQKHAELETEALGNLLDINGGAAAEMFE